MDMRVNLTEEQFASLSGFALGQALIQPAIQQSRGQRLETKKSVYDCLTPGQKSLFGFWVLYGHTQSGWLPFFQEGVYVGGYRQFLPMIKAGLRHINDLALVENVMEAEKLYAHHRESLHPEQEVSVPEEITQAFAQVSETLLALLPETMGKLEAYIRARPEEFLIERNLAISA